MSTKAPPFFLWGTTNVLAAARGNVLAPLVGRIDVVDRRSDGPSRNDRVYRIRRGD